MGSRDKTRFEKWFSLSRHQRRIGAKKLSSPITSDFSNQKKRLIAGDKTAHTHGSSKNLAEHFYSLRHEFSGQSELCFTHAKIIVLIRREFRVAYHFALFEHLWSQEKDFLLENLNTRWLMAAADTFADHSQDNAVKGLSIACSCLLNTVKIQESERFLNNASDNCRDDKAKQARLDAGQRVGLFDGTSVFKFGTDDTLRNMRWRMNAAKEMNVAGEILVETFDRLQSFDTVYKRTKDRHARSKTAWW